MGGHIQDYNFWFFCALGLLALEMLTGTFYMLVLSLGLAAGGVVGLMGGGVFGQSVTAGIISVVGAVVVHRSRFARSPDLNAASQNLDIGQSVDVQTWHKDGTAAVSYRGSRWDAELEASHMPRNKTMYIKAMRGSKLILTDHKPN